MNSSMSHGQNLTLVEFVCTTALKSLFLVPPVYQDFNMCQHWPVKKTIVDLPTNLNGGLRTKISALVHRHY